MTPIRSLAVFLLLAGLSMDPTLATGRYNQTMLVTLPPYCIDSELSPNYKRFGERWQYWTARMGENFNRIHHYCQALLDVREARKHPASDQGRVIYLRRALSELNFILDISPAVLKRFPLWPEMLIRRGEVGVMLGDWGLATASYEQARQVKPDYWPAYLDWAEALESLKLRDRARELIYLGLRIDPGVEAMRKAFVKYGGNVNDIPEKPTQPASAAEPASAVAIVEAASAAPPAPLASAATTTVH